MAGRQRCCEDLELWVENHLEENKVAWVLGKGDPHPTHALLQLLSFTTVTWKSSWTVCCLVSGCLWLHKQEIDQVGHWAVAASPWPVPWPMNFRVMKRSPNANPNSSIPRSVFHPLTSLWWKRLTIILLALYNGFPLVKNETIQFSFSMSLKYLHFVFPFNFFHIQKACIWLYIMFLDFIGHLFFVQDIKILWGHI